MNEMFLYRIIQWSLKAQDGDLAKSVQVSIVFWRMLFTAVVSERGPAEV